MKTRNTIPPPLPPLHKKEEVGIESFEEVDTGVLPRPEAEKIIKEMQDRVVGRVPNSGWVDLPKNEGDTRGQFHFKPEILRLDLERQTISCFGYYSNDESSWLIQVRFLVERPARQPVRFEIKSWFNTTNPALIPLLR